MNGFRTLAVAAIALTTLLAGCERPPVDMVQRGFRGTGMAQVYNPRTVDSQLALNTAPEVIAPAEPGSPAASTVFKNVKVLGDVSVAEFTRTMLAITAWVAPKEGCAYCHSGADFAADDKYAKQVARRMLQMTRHVNADWKNHVAETGVTCYTCHRGQPIPAKVWYSDPGPKTVKGNAGDHAGQNIGAASVGLTSLPYDPFTPFLKESNSIRVAGTTSLPEGNRQSIKQTEWTYALMMNISDSLGVNCTYCHNSRSFSDWKQSPPQRLTAWHGIRMVRDLNNAYLEPLGPTYPKERLGVLGDAPKAYCGTCHQGAYKPLYGAAMAKDYPALHAPAQKVAETK